jgi:putative ABC transport system ATP-binding protein
VKLIGFVFQLYYLLPTLTALENVEIPMLGVVGNARQRSRRAMQLLERVGLAGRASHRPSQLSGGERQRVAIARSLANFPNLILADEPTGNLDSKSSSEIMSLFKDINRTERATIVLVTHDEEIASDASRVIRLLDGRLVADFRRKG